jgi:putative transposase
VQLACRMLGLPRSTFYQQTRRYSAGPRRPGLSPSSRMRRQLETKTEQQILEHLHSERFIDRSATEAYFTLLDEGIYLASRRTFYRILERNEQLQERRALRRHPKYQPPELMATAPCQVWSWDITRVRGPEPGLHFHLYVMLDLFSRFVIGWLLAERESGNLAAKFIHECLQREQISGGNLTIHSDRGAAMQSKPVVALMAALGVNKTNSRPRVSNDNCFSESQFRTTKFFPGYPDRFGSLQDGVAHFRHFFGWYNHHHRHSGLQFLTPAIVHRGRADEVLQRRHEVLLKAFERNPARFPLGQPKLARLVGAVYINPPKSNVPNCSLDTVQNG